MLVVLLQPVPCQGNQQCCQQQQLLLVLLLQLV
jgi:hypothetical protein